MIMEKSGSDIGHEDWDQDYGEQTGDDGKKKRQLQADEGREGVKCKMKDEGG